MIAWARKDCVLRVFMFDHDEINQWEVTRKGLERFDEFQTRFASGQLDVRKYYLWTPAFKKYMYPAYEPSDKDMKRLKDYLNELLL
jgi:hypothetical protein